MENNIIKSDLGNTLVVIPARGGSKRIINKNIKEIFGRPMIYWPLEILSKIFNAENVLVSTDSDMVKSVVEKKGLTVPFKRPFNLSDDFTGTEEVMRHAVDWYETNVRKVNYVLTVYPTAVMLSEVDIYSSLNILFNDPKCDMVMSATTYDFPIQRAILKNVSGYAEIFDKNSYSKRSQDLLETYHDAGQFYLNRIESVRRGKFLKDSFVKLCVLKRNKVVDIDTMEDFKIAEDKLRFEKSNYEKKSWSFKTLK